VVTPIVCGLAAANFCCGSAGVAYFLATLSALPAAAFAGDAVCAARTKARFLAAAESGGTYLLSVANQSDHGLMIFHDEPAHTQLYYFGWCHGPAGTARLWARLHQLTRQARYWCGAH
jgi:hypothetical protein